ncbi:MFS transporter [Streptomyces triculaminicus]|uniref:MFS transporter n=1 Tax=Streptomyces triculaminicus TaxID=2816232 RepID=UPI0037D2BA1B
MTDRPHPGAPAAPARPVLVTLLLVSMLTVMAGATISPALPAMRRHFADVDDITFLVRLVLTVPALAIAVGAPVAGLLVDRAGRKPVLVGSVVLYGLAGGSGLVLGDVYAILAGRVLLGLAVAGVMTAATALVADLYSGPERSRVLGLQAGAMGMGGVVFLSVGGLLAGLDWRGPFAVYLAALPLAALVALVVKEPARAEPPARRAGATGGRAVPGAALAIFALAFVGQAVFYTVPTQLPFHLADLAGVGAVGSGLILASMSAVQATVSANYGRIARGRREAALAAVVFAVLGAGAALIGFAPGVPVVLAGLALIGTGVGLLVPHLNTWLVARTPAEVRGRTLSGITAAMFLGQFLSPVAAQPLAGEGLDTVYLAAAAVALAVSVTVAFAWRRPAREEAAPEGAGAPRERNATGRTGA